MCWTNRAATSGGASRPSPRTAAVAALAPCLLALACAHRPWDEPRGFAVAHSPHFVVTTDAGPDDTLAVVDRLEDVHAALSSTFFSGIDVGDVEVLLLDRSGDFRGMAPPNADGFFAPGLGKAGRGVLVFSTDQDDFDTLAAIASHELAHRFLHATGKPVPAWLHEGFANYVGAIDISQGLVTFDAASIHGGYVYFADLVPLDQLFTKQNLDFHGEEGRALYMTAWFLMREMLSTPGQAPAVRLAALLDGIAASPGVDGERAAVETALGGLALASIQRTLEEKHAAIYHGIGRKEERKTFGFSLHRPPTPPLVTHPADPALVKDLCRTLQVGK